MRKKELLASALAAASLLCTTGCDIKEFFAKDNGSNEQSADYGHELDPEIHQLVADSEYQAISGDGIGFETALSNEDIASNAEVGLYDSDSNKVSDMYDDGTNGDRIAGDGIYACRYKPDVSSETELSYKVKIGDTETDPVNIRYFDDITEKDFETLSVVSDSFDTLANDYKDESGYVAPENQQTVLDKAVDKAAEMVKNGEAVNYRINKDSNNVVVKLSSGITYIYEVPIEGLDGGKSADIDLSITTCQPFKYSYEAEKSERSGYMHCADDGAQAIANEFDNITFDRNIDNQSVSPETIRTFSSNQIILWHGHGTYDSKLHSIILFDMSPSGIYKTSDYVKEALVANNGYLAYTYKFVDAYVGDMSNSLIYLGCCKSGIDGVLASSYMKKNCNVVIANTESIVTTYNISMIQSFSEYLSEERKFLFIPLEYRTASAALSEAKGDLGKDDGSERHAAPKIFGNTKYRLSDALEDNLGDMDTGYTEPEGSITLDKAYVSVKAGGTVSVSISKYPSGYSSSDFTWTMDDTSVATVSGGTVTGVKAGNTVLIVKSSDGKFSQYCAVTVTE